MRDFRKYDVWKIAHEFVLEVYTISKKFPNTEIYGITSQLRRSSVSVPTNISEGCGRSTDKEFARFLHIALGSAHEVEYLLQLSYDLSFISEIEYQSLNEKINLVKRKLFHLETKVSSSVNVQ
jgi:four helix bundle protein